MKIANQYLKNLTRWLKIKRKCETRGVGVGGRGVSENETSLRTLHIYEHQYLCIMFNFLLDFKAQFCTYFCGQVSVQASVISGGFSDVTTSSTATASLVPAASTTTLA